MLLFWQKMKVTFKQVEEKSLSVCDLDGLLIVWRRFLLEFLVIELAEEPEGVAHADGIAEVQAFVVLPKMLHADTHLLIGVGCS